MAPKIVLIGKRGQLGWELHRALLTVGSVIALDTPEIDLLHAETWQPLLRQTRPAVIINAAAYTQVDRAETEPQLALALNGTVPGQLAEIADELGAALIHYSTDYVFDGQAGRAYTEDDAPSPLGAYAHSKMVGEQLIAASGAAHLTLRTSWLYSLRRESFVTKVLAWARRQPQLHVVTDQISNPTWARTLAETTALLLALGGADPAAWIAERRGIYHVAASDAASRFSWAQAILRLDPAREQQVAQAVLPALTADFPTPARRPLNTALDCSLFTQTFGLHLPTWEDALALAMQTD